MNLIFFLLDLIILFFVVRLTTKELFIFLWKITNNKKFSYSIITLIFFPGTIVHELSHFLIATTLFLRVREINLFPEFKKNNILLGSVFYEKKDFVRGILVGIAPVIVGFIFLFSIFYFRIFPGDNIYLNALIIYLIFSISSTMFSSRQDLVDLIYIIPLCLIIWFIVYIFNINVVSLSNGILIKLSDFIIKVNFYLLISILINFSFLIILKVINNFIVRVKR